MKQTRREFAKSVGIGMAGFGLGTHQVGCTSPAAAKGESELLLTQDPDRPEPATFDRLPLSWHKKTAQKLLDKIRAEIDNYEFQPRAYLPKSPLSVSEYCEQWLRIIDVSPNTHKDYRYSVRKFILPYFGDRDIRRIRHNQDPHRVSRYPQYRRKRQPL